MKLQSLSDRQLLQQTQRLVQNERELLGEILKHLKEVERRKLYSDLGYSSLFDYCLRELKYSEAQTGRRLSALKLIRELPQVEEQIASGVLNLTHICQAQSFFSHMRKAPGNSPLTKEDKLKVLTEIENKSARQTQAWLVQKTAQAGVNPQLPAERERVLSEEHSEFRLVINQQLRQRLNEVKSLLGPKALGMSLAELVAAMAELSLEALKDKKFGKKRGLEVQSGDLKTKAMGGFSRKHRGTGLAQSGLDKNSTTPAKLCVKLPSISNRMSAAAHRSPSILESMSGESRAISKKPRSISKSQKWQIWERDGASCQKCRGRLNLQADHRVPVARGGTGEMENLRLLCGSCNLREGIKSFGITKMRRASPG